MSQQSSRFEPQILLFYSDTAKLGDVYKGLSTNIVLGDKNAPVPNLLPFKVLQTNAQGDYQFASVNERSETPHFQGEVDFYRVINRIKPAARVGSIVVFWMMAPTIYHPDRIQNAVNQLNQFIRSDSFTVPILFMHRKDVPEILDFVQVFRRAMPGVTYKLEFYPVSYDPQLHQNAGAVISTVLSQRYKAFKSEQFKQQGKAIIKAVAQTVDTTFKGIISSQLQSTQEPPAAPTQKPIDPIVQQQTGQTLDENVPQQSSQDTQLPHPSSPPPPPDDLPEMNIVTSPKSVGVASPLSVNADSSVLSPTQPNPPEPSATGNTPVTSVAAEPEVSQAPDPISVSAKLASRPSWKMLEPEEREFYVPHLLVKDKRAGDGWAMIGASVRGRDHAHKGKYREDSFYLSATHNWHIFAVSDGAGSRRYSRWGSKYSTVYSVQAVERYWQKHQSRMSNPDMALRDLDEALREGVTAAYRGLEELVESESFQTADLEFRDFGATFLLAIHAVYADEHYIGAFQVGDGAMFLANDPHNYHDFQQLTEEDTGGYANETDFLTSRRLEEWLERPATVLRLERPPWVVMAMTDGISNDLFPYTQHLSTTLLPGLNERTSILKSGGDLKSAAQELKNLIDYERRGSFDDRTLVVLFNPDARFPSSTVDQLPDIEDASRQMGADQDAS